jgi:phosphoglycolate phosphatase-like HAD superfamily hydrolase
MAVRGVILDVDGTLVLSNDALARAWAQAFAEYDHEIAFERIRPLIGMGGDKLMATLVPGLNTREGDGKAISERRKEIFLARYADDLQPAPGAHALVAEMSAAGLRLIAASSATRDELARLLQAAHVADILTETTSADDVEETKSAPDAVAVALQRLALPAAEVLTLGDTPYDIKSAGKCHLGTIALRCGGTPDERLRGAITIYDDPADLHAHYAESPLGAQASGVASR